MSSFRNLAALTLSASILSSLGASDAAADKLVVPNAFPTIQAAVDAAAPGDVVVIKEGTYAENVTIGARQDLTLSAKPGAKLQPAANGVGLLLVGAARIRVLGLEIEGTSDNAIQIQACVDVLIKGCLIRNSGGDAILGIGSSRVVVRENVLTDLVKSGVALIGLAGDISDNQIERAERHGIFVSGPGYTVQRNRVEDTGLQGLEARAFGSDVHADLLVTDNRFERTAGLQVSGFVGVDLLGNTLKDSTADGVLVLNSAQILISGNRIKGSKGDGIELSQTAVVIDNKVSASGSEGIHLLSNAGGSQVKGNKVRTSAAAGIRIDSLGAMVLDNSSTKNLGPNFQSASGNVLLIGNEFSTAE